MRERESFPIFIFTSFLLTSPPSRSTISLLFIFLKVNPGHEQVNVRCGTKAVANTVAFQGNCHSHSSTGRLSFDDVHIVFFEDVKIYSGLWPLSVSPRWCQCVYTIWQVKHQQHCSRTGRVQRSHDIFRKINYLMNTLYSKQF